MYRPLGRGDVDFAAIVSHLRGRDYGGWYVLEQDTILTEEPRGEGPVADVRQSAGVPVRSVDRGPVTVRRSPPGTASRLSSRHRRRRAYRCDLIRAG